MRRYSARLFSPPSAHEAHYGAVVPCLPPYVLPLRVSEYYYAIILLRFTRR